MSLDEYVQQVHRETAAIVEQACEKALQGGVCGVMVTQHETVYDFSSDPLTASSMITATVDADVPYGELYWRTA